MRLRWLNKPKCEHPSRAAIGRCPATLRQSSRSSECPFASLLRPGAVPPDENQVGPVSRSRLTGIFS